MRELDLIAAIEGILGPAGGRVRFGPGDDAAVVDADPVAVTSVDTVVEGVHFDLHTHDHADVGHKALATALADLAAMGARPGEAYVALTVPGSTEPDAALALVEAMAALARRHDVTIAGGDVTAGPVLVASVTVTGWADDAGALAYRGDAAAGEVVGVTGSLGGSAAGLLLLRGEGAELDAPTREALLARHRRPEPRLALGRALAGGASAMIDLSDGVATDAAHVARRSGAAIEVELGRLPLDAGVAAVARAAGRDPAELAATGGEDFELLVCAPGSTRAQLERAARAADSEITWIGSVGPGAGVTFRRPDGSAVQLRGYEHGA
jgi:thiamine-monophosphate kinase